MSEVIKARPRFRGTGGPPVVGVSFDLRLILRPK
jgi:hypothetical protein